MSKFVITGGNPIGGHHKAPGNKNAALPMIACAVMAEGPVELLNLPLISDVRVMLDIVESLGAKVWLDEKNHSVRIDPTSITPKPLCAELCRKVRTSILFAGPLVARFGEAIIPSPGGDNIGRRRLDTHFDGLRGLGVDITETNPFIFRRSKPLQGKRLLFDEASVTATENVVMAAALAEGHTTIYNAACEPHVQDLCHMLNSMGASITGIGTNCICIEGVKKLSGTTAHISGDAIEAASFIAAAAATHGSLTVEGINVEEFEMIARPFARLGVTWETRADGTLYLPEVQTLKVVNDVDNAIPKIEDGIWPAIPSDIMSALIVLATQVDGVIMFFEKMFESRMFFVDHLVGMGARIVLCDPHRAIVHGPVDLHSSSVSSPDIRAGMALLIAALSAKGTTVIERADRIDRGYEAIEVALQAMGANIERKN